MKKNANTAKLSVSLAPLSFLSHFKIALRFFSASAWSLALSSQVVAQSLPSRSLPNESISAGRRTVRSTICPETGLLEALAPSSVPVTVA